MANLDKELLELLAGVGGKESEDLLGFFEKLESESGKDENIQKLREMMKEDDEKKRKGAEKVCREITNVFDENEWKYSEISQKDIPVYVLNFSMRNLNVPLRIIVEYESECIRYDVILPISSKRSNQILLAYKLVELNHPLRYGAFHIDYNDNELSYRYSMPYDSEKFSKSTFEMIIHAMIRTVDRYYEDITKYVFSTIDEEEKNRLLLLVKDNVISLR